MRYGTIAALVIVPAALSQTPASALPCDNTRWCAQYSGRGATNCGFFTIEQCIGGFCVPNQFYNPCRPAQRARKRQAY